MINAEARKEDNADNDEEEESEIHTPERSLHLKDYFKLDVIILTIVIQADDDSTTLSLAESAALQQAKEVKPELKEVEIVTGEENESNVFKVIIVFII